MINFISTLFVPDIKSEDISNLVSFLNNSLVSYNHKLPGKGDKVKEAQNWEKSYKAISDALPDRIESQCMQQMMNMVRALY